VYAPAGGVRAVEPAGLTVTAAGDQLSIGACSTEVRLRLSGKPDPSNPANVLVLQLQAGPGLDRKPARLAWGEPASGRSLTFRLCGDNQAHHYAIRVGSLPSWVLAGEIANLDLTLPAGNWSFAKAQLLALKDIPELATLAAVSHAPAEKPAAQSAAPKPAPVPSKPRRK
jgi:hypothetical protein